jgi:hypothetical protein
MKRFEMSYLLFLILAASLLGLPALASADDPSQKGWMGRLRGEVIKIEGDVYIVEDDLGRRLKLHITPKADRDADLRVGDEIIARTTHRGKDVWIKSIKKIISSGTPSRLVEGNVVKIDGESYLVKDISGKEVRLHVDGRTTKDGNITIGDHIHAHLDGSDSSHADSLSKR